MHPQELAGRPVQDQRQAARRLGRAQLAEWAASPVPEARSAVGYAMANVLPGGDQAPWDLVNRLVNDEHWTVRESAAFGVRDALIAAYSVVAPGVRPWAGPAANDQEHRAFLVLARQPSRQHPAAVAELTQLLRVPLSDPAPYVRKNIPFCLRYLARTHGQLLAGHLLEWAGEPDQWLQRACFGGLTEALAKAAPGMYPGIVAALQASQFRWIRSKAATF